MTADSENSKTTLDCKCQCGAVHSLEQDELKFRHRPEFKVRAFAQGFGDNLQPLRVVYVEFEQCPECNN